MSGRDISWLTARPIAHRGLHDASKGVIENSISAARAAIAAGFGVECDVQLTADRELIVFHDESLDRLTDGAGAVATHRADELRRLRLRGGNE
ncbi:MAG: glycerophosphodiester phosphodiesterase, partial [Alphaproteobacteria bacterium]|nr:glycerophosphodiester phosphodiesterase [Alphaproteobacteria bacterium]